MPVRTFSPRLLALNLKRLFFYDFATLLWEKYRQSMFEPIKCDIPKEEFKLFFEESFPRHENFIHLVNIEFLEHVRIKLLEYEGLPTIDGYYLSKTNIYDIEEYLFRYYC